MAESDTAIASSPAGLRIVTEPPRRFVAPDLRTVWAYRDLLYFLVRRDVALVYKQTAFGVIWIIARPVLFAAVYAALFGWILKVPSEGVPFAAFAIAGMTLWLFFSDALTKTSTSTIASLALISKVYFPRITVPIAAVLPPLVDLAVGLVVLEVALLAFGIMPQMEMLAVPLVLFVLLMMALGAGLILSALGARFRDVELAVAFGLQVLMFGSAVFYPLSFLPANAQSLFSLNPLVGVMETFRAAILPVGGLDLTQLIPGAICGIVLMVAGLFYFARAEQTMVDVI